MNERIKELSKQAWEWAEQQEYKDATQEFSDILEQKFAEMVIRECVATLKEDMELAHIQLIPLDFKMYANGRLQRTIKDHFGVEE